MEASSVVQSLLQKISKKTFLLDFLYLLKTATNSSNVHVDCKTVTFLQTRVTHAVFERNVWSECRNGEESWGEIQYNWLPCIMVWHVTWPVRRKYNRDFKTYCVLKLIPLSFMPSEIELVNSFPQMLWKLKQLRINTTTMIFETIAILRGFSNSTNSINPQLSLHSYNNLLFPRAQGLYQ